MNMESKMRSDMEVHMEAEAPLLYSQHISGGRSGISSQEQRAPVELQPSALLQDSQHISGCRFGIPSQEHRAPVELQPSAPLQDSLHISGRRSGIPRQEHRAPVELQPSILPLMMDENQDFLFNQEINFGSTDIADSEDIWSFEELWAASEGAREDIQEAMGIDAKGIGGGGVGGSDMCQQGSLSMLQLQAQKDMDEVWEEIDKGSLEAQIEAPQMPRAQQKVGSGAIIIDDQQVTLENFLGKPDLVHGPFTSKKFVGAEIAPGQVSLMQQVGHHGPLIYPMVGQGMLCSDGNAKMPLVSLPCEAQAGMAPTIHSSPKLMNSMAKANLMHNIGKTVVVKSRKRKQQVPNEEFIEKKMEQQKQRMIKNRESSSRSRERKQAYVMELESKLSNLMEGNKCLRAKLMAGTAMEKVEEEMTSKNSGRAMHQRRTSCMW